MTTFFNTVPGHFFLPIVTQRTAFLLFRIHGRFSCQIKHLRISNFHQMRSTNDEWKLMKFLTIYFPTNSSFLLCRFIYNVAEMHLLITARRLVRYRY